MRIGVSTAAYYGRMETEESAAFLESLGVPCCEAFLQTYSEYQPEFGRTLKAAAGKMEIVSAHNKTLHFEGDFLAQSPRQRADGFAMLETFLETVQLLGRACTFITARRACAGIPRRSTAGSRILKRRSRAAGRTACGSAGRR